MHEEGCDRCRSNKSYGHSLTELAVPACKSGEYNPPPSVPHMDGKRAAPRKGRRVVFFGGVCTCRAGPMCPAAGYAFFGGARGPRPTGRYVEPRVGDAVPTARQRRAVIARSVATRQSVFLFWGDGFPRQSADWLGMTGSRGGRLCPPCMTAAPCRAGPVCPAVTGVGIRLSSPPSAREVSARSAGGGRDATRFLSPPVGCADSPLPEGA